jgi:hypothetical protein
MTSMFMPEKYRLKDEAGTVKYPLKAIVYRGY